MNFKQALKKVKITMNPLFTIYALWLITAACRTPTLF